MAKTLAVVLTLLVAAVGALYQFAGLRVDLDGSGWRPRFVTQTPDFDALEADRARQRQHGPASQTASPASDPLAAETLPTPPSSQPARRQRSTSEPVAGPGGPDSAAWPDFRGPRRDGRYDGPSIRTNWPPDGLPILWKQPIGLGYASFVAAGGRAFTIEQRREREVVAAYEIRTGRELWTNAWDGQFVEAMGGDGPRATPTYDEGRLYALGALGELRCLDARTGATLWRRNILVDSGASNLNWGMSAAPLVIDDRVIVLPGGRDGRSVAAYDKRSGAPVWHALDDQQAYSSPMLVTLAGVRQLLVLSATRVLGLDPDVGQLLWEYPWVTDMGINVAQPLLLGGDRVFVSAGYGHGAAAFEVSNNGGRFAVRTLWETTRMKNKFTSSVLHGGFIYGLDEAILACLDASTGELRWKAGRYGYGQVLLAAGHLIVLAEDGRVALVRATPDRHEELASFSAIEGKTWNHPIIADGTLLVRNLGEMAAFDIRP
jgi:outer membrane protein assembly factor BamB